MSPQPARPLPRAGSLPVPVVVTPRAPGSIRVERVRARPPGSIRVDRPYTRLPAARTRALTASGTTVGRNDLGTVRVADRVVTKVASRAAAEDPDVGGVAARVLGALPMLSHLGGRASSLDSLPKVSADVDGTQAFLTLDLSVRYPAPVAETADAVRRHVRDRLRAMTGLEAVEIDVTVSALVRDLPVPARVR